MILENWKDTKPENYAQISDDTWECYSFLEDYASILEDSFLKDVKDLDESEFSIPEFDSMAQMIGSSRTKKQKESLKDHQRQGLELIKLIQDQINFTSKILEKEKMGEEEVEEEEDEDVPTGYDNEEDVGDEDDDDDDDEEEDEKEGTKTETKKKEEILEDRTEYKQRFLKEMACFADSLDGWQKFETSTNVQKLQRLLQKELFPELKERKNYMKKVLDFVIEQRNESKTIAQMVTIKRLKQLKSLPMNERALHREQYDKIRNRIALLDTENDLTLPPRSSLEEAKKYTPSLAHLSKLRGSNNVASFFKSQVEISEVGLNPSRDSSSSLLSSASSAPSTSPRPNTTATASTNASTPNTNTNTSLPKLKEPKAYKREKSQGKSVSEMFSLQMMPKEKPKEKEGLTVEGLRRTVKSPLFGKKKKEKKEKDKEKEEK